MIDQVCAHIHNYFEINPVTGEPMIYPGHYTIQNGGISLPFLKPGQYFRVFGSVFNDGVHQYGVDALDDEEFDGVISGVTSWGIYVALENTVEGMVRLTDMTDDRYDYEESKYRVIGHGTGKTYRLGQSVRIRVENVDKVLRNIDFSMVDKHCSDDTDKMRGKQ